MPKWICCGAGVRNWLTASSDGTTYTATFTAAAGTVISNGSVSVDNAWHEINGNPGNGATRSAFVVDTVTDYR